MPFEIAEIAISFFLWKQRGLRMQEMGDSICKLLEVADEIVASTDTV